MDSQDQYPVYRNAGPFSPNLTYTAAFHVEATYHNQAFSKVSRGNPSSSLQVQILTPQHLEHYIPLSFELV